MRLNRTTYYHRDLEQIVDWIAVNSPTVALAIWNEIELQVERLTAFPGYGRIGRVSGTRELVIVRTPYIVPYRLNEDTIDLLNVIHGARQWPTEF